MEAVVTSPPPVIGHLEGEVWSAEKEGDKQQPQPSCNSSMLEPVGPISLVGEEDLVEHEESLSKRLARGRSSATQGYLQRVSAPPSVSCPTEAEMQDLELVDEWKPCGMEYEDISSCEEEDSGLEPDCRILPIEEDEAEPERVSGHEAVIENADTEGPIHLSRRNVAIDDDDVLILIEEEDDWLQDLVVQSDFQEGDRVK